MSKLLCVSHACGLFTADCKVAASAAAHNCRVVQPNFTFPHIVLHRESSLQAPQTSTNGLQWLCASEDDSRKDKQLNCLSFLTEVYSSKRTPDVHLCGAWAVVCMCKSPRSGIKIPANVVHAHPAKLSAPETSTSLYHRQVWLSQQFIPVCILVHARWHWWSQGSPIRLLQGQPLGWIHGNFCPSFWSSLRTF